MKEYFSFSDVEHILKTLDGECIPIVFIDHIIIFYNNGDIKEVKSEDIQLYFPNISHTTMNMIKNHKEIAEINVKVDVKKIYNYANGMSVSIATLFDDELKKKSREKVLRDKKPPTRK